MIKFKSLISPPRSDNKKTFKSVCDRFDLVYFGGVSQHNDEHQMVRGFTLLSSYVDRHYCVGTVSGHDVILLERTDTISFPDRPSRKYTWVLLQIDLAHLIPVHIMLNANKTDDKLYSTLLLRHHTMQLYDRAFVTSLDSRFASIYRLYAPIQHMSDVARLIPTQTASVLGYHFNSYDYEMFHDRLIVISQTDSPTPHMIEKMFEAGIWLASEINKVA